MTPDSPAPVPPDGEPDTAGIEAAKQAVYESMPVVLKDLVSRSEAEAAIGVPHGAGVPDRWLADVAVRAYLAAGRAAATPPDTDLLTELVKLTEIHHNTIRPSKKHDPENQDWRDCPCLTCKRVACVEAVVLAEGRAAATPDPPDMTNMCEGESPDHKPGITPAASPDERLREAGEQLANLVTLLGGYDGPGYLAAPNQGEHPDYYAAAKLFDRIMRDEKTGAAVVLAQWRAALAAADRDGERIPDSEFVVPPLLPPDPITERMIDVADDAFRHGSSDEQAWRECLGDALHAVYPLIRERVMAEMVQGKVPAADREENTDG